MITTNAQLEVLKGAFMKRGKQLWLVGGAARAGFTGEDVHDVDLATDATPDEMIRIGVEDKIPHWFTLNSLKHGTVTFEPDGKPGIEITTFRKDVSCDGKNATVEFAQTVEEDLARRDVTINAIAINLYNGDVVDPHNGIGDARCGIVRAVGKPTQRLKESTIRAMRAVEIANRLDFDIDGMLACAISETNIMNNPVEVLRDYLIEIFKTGRFWWIGGLGLLEQMIPEMNELNIDGGPYHKETVYEHTFMTVYQTQRISEDWREHMAALLHDIGKGRTNDDGTFKEHEMISAETAYSIMQRLKFSKEDTKFVMNLIMNHMRWHFDLKDEVLPTKRAVRRAIQAVGVENVQSIIRLCWADRRANGAKENVPDFDLLNNETKEGKIFKIVQSVLNETTAFSVKDLEIGGKDLIEMGLKPGPFFAEVLNDCLEKVMNEELNNDNMALRMHVAKEWVKKVDKEYLNRIKSEIKDGQASPL